MKRLISGVLVAALAACAGPRPNAPRDAQVTPPPAWRGPTSTGEIDAEWWNRFHDPQLTENVRLALANNVNIATAVSQVEEARAQFRLARSYRFPMVNGQLNWTRSRAAGPMGKAMLATAEEAELTVSYDVDLFGKLRFASESARASLLATEAGRDNVRLAVASSTASAYIALVGYDQRLRVLRETLVSNAESLRIADRQLAAGYGSLLDQAQAEAQYRATAEQIPSAELAVMTQEHGLSVLLGENPRGIPRAGSLADISLPEVPTLMPSALLRRRPDIVQAEQEIVAADLSLDSARAQFMPDLQLSGVFALTNPNIFHHPFHVWSFGGSLLAPIFEGGRLRAQADIAVAQRDQAAYSYRSAALTAFREVEDALSQIDRRGAEERALALQRTATARALRLSIDRYRAGYSSYLEQLDAQRTLLSVDLSVVQNRSDRLSSAVTLYQALGGGWQPTAAMNTAAAASAAPIASAASGASP